MSYFIFIFGSRSIALVIRSPRCGNIQLITIKPYGVIIAQQVSNMA